MKVTIDTTMIEGFDQMSVEDQLKALLGYEFEDNSEQLSKANADLLKQKNAIDKLTSENAEYMRNSRSQLSEKDQELENLKDMVDQLTQQTEILAKNERIGKLQGEFLKRGYTSEQANAIAQAWEDGNINDFLSNSDAFLKTHDENYKKTLMSETMVPETGKPSGGGSVDYSKLIADAQAAGNWQLASHYTRLSQEQPENK